MPDWKTLIFIIATAFSTFFFFDARYADSAYVEQVAMRLDQKILSDRLQVIQQRVWQLEDRHRGQSMPQSVLDEYRRLIEEKKRIEKQISKIGG